MKVIEVQGSRGDTERGGSTDDNDEREYFREGGRGNDRCDQ